MQMPLQLESALSTLRSHEAELRALGVAHAAIFGSVARGEASSSSDVDVLIDLEDSRAMGVFEYSRLKMYLNGLFDGCADVANRRTLKPLLRDSILASAIHAF